MEKTMHKNLSMLGESSQVLILNSKLDLTRVESSQLLKLNSKLDFTISLEIIFFF